MKYLQLDILLVQDTGMEKSTYSLKIRDYNIIISPYDPDDPAGRVACIYHSSLEQFITNLNTNNISPTPPFNTSNRLQLIKISYPIETYIINAYAQSNKPEQFEKINNFGPLILGGDLNSYETPELDAYSTKSKPRANPRPIKQLLNNGLTDSFRFLHPHKQNFTRLGERKDKNTNIIHTSFTRIDHLLITEDIIQFLYEVHITKEDYFNSDHRLVYMDLKSEKVPPHHTDHSFTARKGIKEKSNWKTSFKNALSEKIKNLPPQAFSQENYLQEYMESLSEDITKVVMETVDQVFPTYTVYPKSPEELDPTIENNPLTNKLCNALHKTKSAIKLLHKAIFNNSQIIPEYVNDTIDFLNQNICKDSHAIRKSGESQAILIALNEVKTFLHRTISRKTRAAKKAKIARASFNKLEFLTLNPDKLYDIYKNSKRNKVEMISKLINGKIRVLFDQEMIEEITKNWKNIFSNKVPPKDLTFFLQNMPKIIEPENIIPPDFSPENLKRIVKNKKNTAPGESKVSWKCLKHAPDELFQMLSNLYKSIYENKYIPEKWRQGLTVLFDKPTPDIGLDKFRPITLLSVEYKLYTHALNDALSATTQKNNLMPSAQNGFLQDRGSDQCIHTLINIIDSAIKNNRELHVLYIDFAKAFDSVEHWVLKAIFEHINLGYLGEVILNTIGGSFTRIETALGWSDPVEFTRGTKQGDIISPTLFVFFMAPLLWTLHNSNLGFDIIGQNIGALAVADDVALIAETNANIAGLFDILKRYANDTGIQIKPSKSASAYRSASPFIPIVDGAPFKDLGNELSYKYLGIHINLNLDWELQHTTSLSAYKSAVNIILKKFYLPCNLHIKLINTIPIAAIAYRMQFLMFDEIWLNSMLNWTIRALSRTHHSYAYRIVPELWTSFKGLIDPQALNTAIYVNNIVKNLNKPKGIAYNSLAQIIAPSLSKHPNPKHKYTFSAPELIIKNMRALNLDVVNTYSLLEIAKIHENPETYTKQDWKILSKNYGINLTKDLLQLPPTIMVPKISNYNLGVTFTDGSADYAGNKMSCAVLAANDENSIIAIDVNGPLGSMHPELVAIEISIYIYSTAKVIIIYTDSLSAIRNIKSFKNLNTNGKLKNTNRTVLNRIFDMVEKNNYKFYFEQIPDWNNIPEGKSIFLYHIHSHLLTNKKKKLLHFDKHKKALGKFVDTAIALNDLVDKEALEKCRTALTNHPKVLVGGADIWTVVNRETEEPVYKPIKKYLYNRIVADKLSNYVSLNHKFAERMFHPEVSAFDSTTSFRVKKFTFKNVADFMQKLFDKSLNTRETMCANRKKKSHKPHSNPIKEKILENKYSQDFCTECNVTLEVKVMENHEHVFTHCPKYKNFKNNMYDNVIKLINDHAKKTIIFNFPPWFTCDKGRLPLDKTEERLYNFPKNLGDMGYIPKALKIWLKSLKIKKCNKLVKKIVLLIQTSIKNIWLARCDSFHKKFTTIMKDTQTNAIQMSDQVDGADPEEGDI